MKSFLLSPLNLPLVWTLTKKTIEARLQHIQLLYGLGEFLPDALVLLIDLGEVFADDRERLNDLLLIHRF
jgi:hypothetical protein